MLHMGIDVMDVAVYDIYTEYKSTAYTNAAPTRSGVYMFRNSELSRTLTHSAVGPTSRFQNSFMPCALRNRPTNFI